MLWLGISKARSALKLKVHIFKKNFFISGYKLKCGECKTRENYNFLERGKMVISAKNRNFTFFEATRVTCDVR